MKIGLFWGLGGKFIFRGLDGLVVFWGLGGSFYNFRGNCLQD